MMNKVVCPACGLVNLDRFVTFPNCAGCGARLPEVGSQPQGGVLRRPLQAVWWATIVGVGCAALALAVVGITRETTRREDGHLVVYAQVPRVVPVAAEFGTQFHLDSIEDGGAESYSDIRVRLAAVVLRDFELVSAEPLPRQVFETSGGRYLLYTVVQRETPIRLTMKPRKPGEYRFNVQIYSRDFYPVESRNFVTVLKPVPRSRPAGAILKGATTHTPNHAPPGRSRP